MTDGERRRGDTGPARERGAVEYVTTDLMAALAAEASRRPRGRINFNFHLYEDSYQRLLNVVQPGSYIRPHAHIDPPKAESFIVLAGEIGFLHFASDGRILEARRLGPGREALGVDLRPGVWHSFVALAPDTVVFEGKNGPYDPAGDKAFAPWAPPEGDPAAAAYLEGLLRRLPD
jgi:cupin fold WbuC family metalloprotein